MSVSQPQEGRPREGGERGEDRLGHRHVGVEQLGQLGGLLVSAHRNPISDEMRIYGHWNVSAGRRLRTRPRPVPGSVWGDEVTSAARSRSLGEDALQLRDISNGVGEFVVNEADAIPWRSQCKHGGEEEGELGADGRGAQTQRENLPGRMRTGRKENCALEHPHHVVDVRGAFRFVELDGDQLVEQGLGRGKRRKRDCGREGYLDRDLALRLKVSILLDEGGVGGSGEVDGAGRGLDAVDGVETLRGLEGIGMIPLDEEIAAWLSQEERGGRRGARRAMLSKMALRSVKEKARAR